MQPSICTIHDLIIELEQRSNNIQVMNLRTEIPDAKLGKNASKLANDSDDLDRVGNTIEELIESGTLSYPDAEGMVRDLATNQNFYGNYCELRVYGWLHCRGARFHTQIQLTGTDVLNPNGCVIDGLFDYSQVYFDIKAFGFQEYVVENFRTTLENNLPGMTVTIDGSMDVSVKDIERHAFPQVSALAERLQEGCHQNISQLNWTIRAHPRQSGSISFQENVINPFRLAKQNRHYPFKAARQFTRKAPFLLIFPYATAFNKALNQNFANSTEITLRALARRAFMQFTKDKTPANRFDGKVKPGVSIADTARLLSGLLFINLDQEDRGWLFLNPRSSNLLTRDKIEIIFDFNPPPSVPIDDFKYDNY